MYRGILAAMAIVAACWVMAGTAGAADAPSAAPDKAAVDAAFDALKTFDFGSDRKILRPLEDAVVLAHGDAAAQKALEGRLLAVLKTEAPRGAKDFAIRQLSLLATAQSVPAMSALLADKDLSHMARYVLERIAGPESLAALREALPKANGRLKVGVIVSLGARRDAESVLDLVALLASDDAEVAVASARALGSIGTPEAADGLAKFQAVAPANLRSVAGDACLAAAQRLVAAGKLAQALAIYKSLAGPEQPKQIRLAATRGILAAAGKK